MLIVLVQYLGSFERILRYIKTMDRVRKVMKLRKIPHKSTISRELKRMPVRWILVVLREGVKIVGILGRFAVDSASVQISYRSYYYTHRYLRGLQNDRSFDEIR